jgi:4-hydroxybenzoate polyprenyltransferase
LVRENNGDSNPTLNDGAVAAPPLVLKENGAAHGKPTDELEPVIAVDLDGTLTLTDTLHESAIALLRARPLSVFALPLWLLQGKAALKARLASTVSLDITVLPYNEALLEWLRCERGNGRTIALCTAADQSVADAIAIHLGLFDEVIASDGVTNNQGAKKRAALEAKFGRKGYDYVGNSKGDLEAWEGARQAILVNADREVEDRVRKTTTIVRVFRPEASAISQWLRLIRVHQWVKNLLLFVPLLASHQFGNMQALITLVLAFISFSFCASAVYVVNDLIDLESDRKHPKKRSRAFASAVIPVKYGAAVAPVLITLSMTIGAAVGAEFAAWLVLYFGLTCVYSLVLKRFVLIDCLALAALYTLRILAGAAAVGVTLSFWLLAFSGFLFLSLAFVKRYSELQLQAVAGRAHAHGRGYAVTDAPLVQTLGVTAGYSAALVLALYLNGETVALLYRSPSLIWLAVPIVLFWISWAWMKAHRGEMHDDPVIFALRDKTSLFAGLLFAAVFVLAKVV